MAQRRSAGARRYTRTPTQRRRRRLRPLERPDDVGHLASSCRGTLAIYRQYCSQKATFGHATVRHPSRRRPAGAHHRCRPRHRRRTRRRLHSRGARVGGRRARGGPAGRGRRSVDGPWWSLRRRRPRPGRARRRGRRRGARRPRRRRRQRRRRRAAAARRRRPDDLRADPRRQRARRPTTRCAPPGPHISHRDGYALPISSLGGCGARAADGRLQRVEGGGRGARQHAAHRSCGRAAPGSGSPTSPSSTPT